MTSLAFTFDTCCELPANQAQVIGCTVQQAYQEYLVPEQFDCSKGTRNDSARYVRFWGEFEQHFGRSIPCQEISTKILDQFRDWLVAKPLGNGQVNKAWKLVKRIATLASDELDFPLRRIRTRCLPTRPALKHYIDNEQVGRLWEAAGRSQWPRESFSGVPAPTFWRAALVFLRSYGMRVQDLVAYERRKSPVEWPSITFAPRSPNPEGRTISPLGWLYYQASKTGRDYWLPLTPATRAAAERLAAYGTDGRVFKCPMGQRLNNEWHQIQDTAGVCRPTGKHYQLEDFRKTAATYLAEHNGDLPYEVCGWSTARSKIASDHYINSERLLVKYLPDAPVPVCFSEWSEQRCSSAKVA